MNKSLLAALVLGLVTSGLGGCSTAPPTEEGKAELHDGVSKALSTINREDPDFPSFLSKAHAYVVFPTVGEGAFIFGGGRGRGEVYRGNELLGSAQLTFATVGLQAGGQAYTEIIAFETPDALERFVNGKFEFSAKASAVALKDGASKAARYTEGVAVFIYTKGGLMAQAALGGQKFSFVPAKL